MITWPFRAINQAESAVVETYHRRQERFRRKYRHSKFFAPLIGTLVWLVIAPLRLLWWVISTPLRLISGTATTIDNVRDQRQLMHLLQGIPAFLVAIGVFAVLMMLTLQADALSQTYRQASQRAFSDGNFERAQLYLERVLQLDADNEETSYLLARTFQKTGQPERAFAILDSLAPDDRTGYPKAHLWKAAFLAEDAATFQSMEQIQKLESHLRTAETTLQGDPDLHYYLGRFLLAISNENDRRHLQEAFDHLEKAARTRPELNFELYAISKYLDRKDDKAQTFALASAYFEQQLEASPRDEDARTRLIQLAMDQNDHDRMFELLQDGVTLNPNGPMKEALARGYVYRYSFQTPEERRKPAFGLSLLGKALEIDPNCKPALNALLQFGEGQDANAVAIQQAHEMLERLIAVGQSSALAHLALGIKSWQQDDAANAVWHLERAYKLDPEAAALANNLAWLLAFDEANSDPERALTVINSVLETHPNVPAYIETRGQILVKLERWNEALDDLERALPSFQRNIQLHESLATVYEHIGQKGLAAKHTTVANNLRTRETSPDNLAR